MAGREIQYFSNFVAVALVSILSIEVNNALELCGEVIMFMCEHVIPYITQAPSLRAAAGTHTTHTFITGR